MDLAVLVGDEVHGTHQQNGGCVLNSMCCTASWVERSPIMARRWVPAIPDDLLDQLLGGIGAASAQNSPDWMNGLKKALAEKALSAEMDYHLGAEG